MRLRLLLAVLLGSLAFASSASAERPLPGPVAPAPVVPITTGSPTSPSTGGGLLGSPDTTESLGGTDANCNHGTGLSLQVIDNCAASGLSESAYPPGNFGTDTHVDTGITDPGNDLASILQNLFGWIFALMAHILTWIILGLGLAFSFDLFRSDHAGQISHGLAQAEHFFTFPLLPIFVIIGAVVGVVYWVGHRAEGRAVAHWGTMAAMMAAALIIISNPLGVFGWADDAANGIAAGSLSAFTGQGGGTNAGFADAAPALYRTTMEEPWCAMEFGNVTWCMDKIDPKMQAARASVLQHLPQALGDEGNAQLANQQAPLERLRLEDAKTNGELFLSFIPNADARNGQNDNWTLYHALLNDRPDLASIRGPGGVGEHIVVLILSGLAGIFFFVLLLYIAWQLIVNSVFFVLCLLMTPVVIFAPAFGEGGRAVFLKWLVWMFEALAKKVIFAIYLGVVLLISNVFFAVGPSLGGWLIEWLILAGIWAMAFVYRHKILGMMTAGAYHQHGAPNMAYSRFRGSRDYMRRTPSVEGDEVHNHSHQYDGDTYFQHAHVYGAGDASHRTAPREAVHSINGEARELKD